MTRTERTLERLQQQIDHLTNANGPITASYQERDNSVQAELRLSAPWSIRATVDTIHYPKRLQSIMDVSGEALQEQDAPWTEMRRAEMELQRVTLLAEGSPSLTLAASSKTQVGAARRTEAKAAWQTDTRRAFLAAYKSATGKRRLAEARKNITTIQAQQKLLLREIRRRNSAYVATRSQARAEQQARNTEAMASGRFWEADRDTIKAHFRPPFDKNFLADVSERWRAALFVECESESYRRYDDQWGHKLTGTGNGYLCGIDDNGDEWGHRVSGLYQDYDDFGSPRPEGTVEEAMSLLFDVPVAALDSCLRQGDLLFRPLAQLPEGTALEAEETWEPRPSHTITGQGLQHNGRYFKAPSGATVTHTSHAAVVLHAGVYRLHVSSADAD